VNIKLFININKPNIQNYIKNFNISSKFYLFFFLLKQSNKRIFSNQNYLNNFMHIHECILDAVTGQKYEKII
jgi:hypothetical protein